MAFKQTAVEWLVNEITSVNTNLSLVEIVKQAKQMEKEQITKAYNSAIPFKFGEEYYKETYSK